jgi:signal transduction histidine kinase
MRAKILRQTGGDSQRNLKSSFSHYAVSSIEAFNCFVSMSFSKSFTRQSRAWIIFEMTALLVVIAALDFVTSYRIRFVPFYAVPIFVLAWFCDKKWGIAAGLFSSLTWWCANRFTGDPDLRGPIAVWEVSRQIAFFLAVAVVGSALRTKSDIAAERIALLEHSQRLEREIVNISEAEQRRIGQDLHDGLCQYLAGLTCAASSLRDDLKELRLYTGAKNADELVRLLGDAVVQTRELARKLVPAHINRLGLVLALESLTQSVTRLHGVNCTLQCQVSSANWDEHTAMHLYRIAQEAINNATRHGTARNIFLSLDATGRSIRLRVVDDGAGFSESQSQGMGLDIMRYRARLIGGKLTIKRQNGRGTIVTCTARTNLQQSESADV